MASFPYFPKHQLCYMQLNRKLPVIIVKQTICISAKIAIRHTVDSSQQVNFYQNYNLAHSSFISPYLVCSSHVSISILQLYNSYSTLLCCICAVYSIMCSIQQHIKRHRPELCISS